MHNWRLLLLAFLAVLQPIVSFTERSFFDGREKCYERNSLSRVSRLSHGIDCNKLPEDRRLSHSASRVDQRHEIRRERHTLARPSTERRFVKRPERDETRFSVESTIQRGNVGDNRRENADNRHERLSALRDDRQWRIRDTHRTFTRNTDRHQYERDVPRIRFSRESDRNIYESSSSRSIRYDNSISRDMPSERRFRISMESRREEQPNSNISKERIQERRETREILQRAGNDVAPREFGSAKQDRRIVRKRMEERRERTEFRLQQNREPRSLYVRMREVSNDRRSNRVRELGEFRVNAPNTLDKRQHLTERIMEQRDGNLLRYGTTSTRRESRDRTLNARNEVRDTQERNLEERKVIRDRTVQTRESRDRTMVLRREVRDTRDRNLETRREVRDTRDRTLEAQRAVRDRTLQIRESRDRSLDARKEVSDTRDRALEARREVRDRTLQIRDSRDRSLEARKEVRDTQNRALESRREVRYTRDRDVEAQREIRDTRVRDLEARREIRDTRDRSLEARREVRGRTLQIRESRDRSLDARKQVRDTRDRTLEARREVRDRTIQTRESRDRSLEARKEVRDTQDRTLEARREVRNTRDRYLEARREIRDTQDRTLEARNKFRASRAQTLDARRTARDVRGRSLETRRESREVRDRTLVARRNVKEVGVKNSENQTGREVRSQTEIRGVESMRMIGRELRSIAIERKNQLESNTREILSFDASRTRTETRGPKSAERNSYRSSTEFFRSHKIFAAKPQSDGQTINWQYVFYTVQGIYLCSILMQMLSQEGSNKKSRTLAWLTYPRSLVKVD